MKYEFREQEELVFDGNGNPESKRNLFPMEMGTGGAFDVEMCL